MRKIALLLISVFFSFQAYCQIYFQNPSLEEKISDCDYTLPPEWTNCYLSFVVPCICCPQYIPAYDEKTYFIIGGGNNTEKVHQSAAQKLNCNLVKGKLHHFSLYDYHIFYPGWQYGQVEFWGGNYLCDRQKLLWKKTVTDTSWNRSEVSFIPDKNYDYIIFSGTACNTCSQVYIGIDDLSEITVDNYNFLSTAISDTVIKVGNCLTLSASSDDDSATYQWSSIPPGFNGVGDSVIDCPQSNTKYICSITSGCGMQKSDTVNLEVIPDGVADLQAKNYVFTYPNPTNDLISISYAGATDNTWFISYDILGKEINRMQLIKGKGTKFYHTNNLSCELYFYKVIGLLNNERREGKIIITR